MKRWMKATMAAFLLAGTCVGGAAEASNLDTYRNLLLKKTYTIRYVNVTPEERVTNKDKVSMTGRNSLATKNVSQLTYKPLECVVTSDGKRKYEESGMKGLLTCRLQNEKGTYVFTKIDEEALKADKPKSILGKISYSIWGKKKNEVSAQTTNKLAYLLQGDSYGGEDMTRLLNAFLPNDKKSADMPTYEYVTEGWLPNGQNYVDYKSTESENVEAVRYYFDGYTLVKIASAQIKTGKDGKSVARRNIIEIKEFSPTPSEEYLKLPEGIKDTTKEKKEDKGE